MQHSMVPVRLADLLDANHFVIPFFSTARHAKDSRQRDASAEQRADRAAEACPDGKRRCEDAARDTRQHREEARGELLDEKQQARGIAVEIGR